MRIDANGHVGIGTENPVDKLTIEGTDPVGDARYYLSLNNHSLSNRSYAMMRLTAGETNSYTYLSHHAETYDYEGDKYSDFGQLESTGRGLILRASAVDGVIKFLVGGKVSSVAERMRINELGNIGIGTDQPKSRLQIANGDIFIEDINSGVIMKSPNGSCWRLTINDDGSMNTTNVTCPD